MGLSLPLVAAAASIPHLISLIGLERFGLLTVAWGLIGFAGVFDLGVGRAATQIISQLLSENKSHEVPAVIKTASSLSLRMGLCGAFLLALIVMSGVHENIKFDRELSSEVELAAYLLAMAIPVQAVSAMFRGVNEAFQAFREINLIRVALGVANFIGPLLVAYVSVSLVALVLTLLLSRLVALALYSRYAYVNTRVSQLNVSNMSKHESTAAIATQLISFGGWVTVSNVVTPILMQSDRLLIGAIVSAAAVAIYVIPYEMVVQSLVVCGAITTTIFPVLSGMVKSDPEKINHTFYKWLSIAIAVMLFIAVCIFFLAQGVLALWLGATLDVQSVDVARILATGLVPYAIGSMYLALIHAHSRPDVTAKAHMAEMPIFLLGLYWMVGEYGVVGAAIAWCARVTVDAVILIIWFHRYRAVK